MSRGDAGAYLVGVELGGTKSIATLGTGPDEIRDQASIPTTLPEETLGKLAEQVRVWLSDASVAAIGIAAFGPLDLDSRSPTFGRLRSTPKPGWTGAHVLSSFRTFGSPLRIDTDVNGAALAEGLWGAAMGLDNYAYVTVGTGVGVGSVVNGSLLQGAFHSEAGHQRVARLTGDSWPGACPFHGDCVEGLASGAAINAAYGSATPAADWDGWARVTDALAMLFHNLVLTTLPTRILVGGGVVTANPHLLDSISERLHASLRGYADMDLPADFIRAPALGAQAGPLGALAIAAVGMNAFNSTSLEIPC